MLLHPGEPHSSKNDLAQCVGDAEVGNACSDPAVSKNRPLAIRINKAKKNGQIYEKQISVQRKGQL